MLVLSFIWSVVFSLYIFSYTTFIFGWAGVFLAHAGIIFAVYYTFKQFHRGIKNDQSPQKETEQAEYSPPKLIIFALVIFIIFIFTRGLMVLDQNENSYSVPFKGPETTTLERIERFFLNKK